MTTSEQITLVYQLLKLLAEFFLGGGVGGKQGALWSMLKC